MEIHLHREIDILKSKILSLGDMVEENLLNSIKAVENNDIELAKGVMELDNKIDHMELEVEEDCLKILALHQPVAVDLRLIVAILKINSDLERIGDLAGNIAELVTMKQIGDSSDPLFDFTAMAKLSRGMVKDSLESLVNMNSEIAFKVCKDDDRVDKMYYEMRDKINEEISKTPQKSAYLISHLTVYRMLERVADHATNIAEDVIYMIEGDIVRHRM